MRVHCLGVGSIGSLIATNIAKLPSAPQVRLILRKKAFASALASEGDSSIASSSTLHGPRASLIIERDGLAQQTSGFELELMPSPYDLAERSRVLPDGSPGGSAKAVRSTHLGDLVRNDPISTLIVTTKAPQTIPAIQPLLPRLSSSSTIVLCQNGMGVLEALLERYWPNDSSDSQGLYGTGGRPNFICATTTHGVWRKGPSHFVHAGLGDFKFGVVPNRATLSAIAASQPNSQSSRNPLLDARSTTQPVLDHVPVVDSTRSLHQTISALLSSELGASWLPLSLLQLAQLQKLAVNTCINGLTALIGVHNGAVARTSRSRHLVETLATECSNVFAAHVAYEQGSWSPADTHRLQNLPPPLPESHILSSQSLTDYAMRVARSTSLNMSSTLQDVLSTTAVPPISSNSSGSRSSTAAAAPNSAVEAASRTEIDFINGYVVALASRYGVPAPTVELVGQLVLIKEQLIRSGDVGLVERERASKKRATTAASTTAAKAGKHDQTESPDSGREDIDSFAAAGRRKKKRWARARKHLELRQDRFERDRKLYDERSRRARSV